MISKKVCVIGDFAVGKSSLIRRYVLNEFSSDYQATLGVNIYKFSDDVARPHGGTEALNLIIWDIEGGEPTGGKIETYLQGAAGAIVVGDITRQDPFKAMIGHATQFEKLRPGRPIVFAINKIDLLDGPPDAAQGNSLAEQFGTQAVYTSAADGTAVPDLFRTLGARILQTGA